MPYLPAPTVVAFAAATSLVVGLLFFVAAGAQARRRPVAAAVHGASGLLLLLVAAVVGLLGINLVTYHRLTRETLAAEIGFERTGEREYSALIRYADGRYARFNLAGDEWQVDARVLKWKPYVNLIGFDAAYRLERLSGRYTDIASERAEPRTVHALNPAPLVDAWQLARRYRHWMPWVDALYGSATFLPMRDGATYAVSMTQTGLVARPLNEAARQAIASWH